MGVLRGIGGVVAEFQGEGGIGRRDDGELGNDGVTGGFWGEVEDCCVRIGEVYFPAGGIETTARTLDDQTQAQLNEALYHHALALAALERVTAGGFTPGYRRP